MLLIDTNVTILLRDRDFSVAEAMAAQSEDLALSLVSLIQLEGGVVSTPESADDRRAALNSLLRRTTILLLDRDVVAAYVRILHSCLLSRRRTLDRLIAATAIVHDVTLVTINGPDFYDIPGLKLEVWPTPTQ